MKIQAFIFTKDRAAQLRLLLESFERNCPGMFEPYILWRASSADYNRGYAALSREELVPWTAWVEEAKPIRQHFFEAIRYAQERSGAMAIFTDDCIFYRPCKATAGQVLATLDERTFVFSLRFGYNTRVQDYSLGSLQPPLQGEPWQENGTWFVRWNFKQYNWTQNYGYPFGMDGHVFRTEDLITVTQGIRMRTFREWEGTLCQPGSRNMLKKAYMAALANSCVVNNPCNSMQWPPLEAGRFHPFGAAELNEKYLDGWAIDLDGFDFSDVRGAHQEFPIKFRKLA